MAEYSQKWHNGTSRTRSTKTSDGLAAIQAQLNNLGREIKKEKGFGSLPSSTESNPRDHVKSISTTVEVDSNPIRRIGSPQYAELATVKYPKGIAEDVLVGIGKFVFLIDFIILDMLEDVKVPLILGRPFLSTAHAKIDVFKRKIALKIVENMDGYRDQDMGDVIFGEPFCKASCVEARRFDGLITIHNGNDNVTYQMARSHPRFKHLSNAQCNKIRPLLKVSVHDKLNGISHPYQKLKSFYKGVLNLGPGYIRDAKMEEWLTRRHISVHEME
ncbi:reverse transcriptase domain-containing protein [Tanacetum coccineum]